jgi:hypothetical protein
MNKGILKYRINPMINKQITKNKKNEDMYMLGKTHCLEGIVEIINKTTSYGKSIYISGNELLDELLTYVEKEQKEMDEYLK